MDNNVFKFRQHIPNFVDTDGPVEITGTFAEIISHEQIGHWVVGGKGDAYHWVYSLKESGRGLLMVQNQDNTKWWVVGYINDNPGLPIWESPHKEKNPVQKVTLSDEERVVIESRINKK